MATSDARDRDNGYAKGDPSAVWRAAAPQARSSRRPARSATRPGVPSSSARVRFSALLALIVFGIGVIFGSIPDANVIYVVAGVVIFGGYTIFDFNRLRRTEIEDSIPIAPSIFLAILNALPRLLALFGGERS